MPRSRNSVASKNRKKKVFKLAQALENIANVEELPKLEGKRMFLMLSPKK